jgi:type IV pilus assembly protein PilV
MRPHARMRGVTLIEVLVTMVIVAIGLLGLAGMQMRGLSIQKDAHGRSIATQLALDLADRMRANRQDMAVSNDYTFTAAIGSTWAAPPTDCAAAKTLCSWSEQAQYDMREQADGTGWLSRLQAALPNGWAHVVPVAGSPGEWDVTMMWQETGFHARSEADIAAALPSSCGTLGLPYTVPSNVECLQIRVRP